MRSATAPRRPADFSRKLTPRERKAFRWGYLTAIADDAAQLEERRIRIAAHSREVKTPTEWPRGGDGR